MKELRIGPPPPEAEGPGPPSAIASVTAQGGSVPSSTSCPARSIAIRSSRTLPGQAWLSSTPSTRSSRRLPCRSAKCWASGMISSGRAASGGSSITTPATRWNRPRRNGPRSRAVQMSSWTAQITRKSTRRLTPAPSACTSPDSKTRSSFPCASGQRLVSSSRNRVPPSDRSMCPTLTSTASMNARARRRLPRRGGSAHASERSVREHERPAGEIRTITAPPPSASSALSRCPHLRPS